MRQGAKLLTDVALDIYLSGKILNAFAKLGKTGLAQRAETVPLIKELRPRRSASFHPAQSDELVISAEKAAKILVDNKPYSPAAEVIELTSQRLINELAVKDVLDSIRNLGIEKCALLKYVRQSYSENGAAVREMLKNSFSIVGKKSKPYPAKQALAELNGKMPALNLPHLFGCEINRRGDVVGFHHARQFPERIIDGSKQYFNHKVFKADYKYNGQTLTVTRTR